MENKSSPDNKIFKILSAVLIVTLFLAIAVWPSSNHWSVYPVVVMGLAMILILFLRIGGKGEDHL